MTNVFVDQAATRSEGAAALESLGNEIRDDRSRRKETWECSWTSAAACSVGPLAMRGAERRFQCE